MKLSIDRFNFLQLINYFNFQLFALLLSEWNKIPINRKQ